MGEPDITAAFETVARGMRTPATDIEMIRSQEAALLAIKDEVARLRAELQQAVVSVEAHQEAHGETLAENARLRAELDEARAANDALVRECDALRNVKSRLAAHPVEEGP